MKNFYTLLLALLITLNLSAQSFKVIPLGVKGGLDESNLSSYMLAPQNSDNYICLDAGTIYYGLTKAVKNGLFNKSAEEVLNENIKAYLISHAHLDHVSGLLMNAPADSKKTIYSSPFVIEAFKDKYFSWVNWANFADEGEKPQLGTYSYHRLEPLKEIKIKNTDLYVTPFNLSHGNPYQSLAFLVRYKQNFILYLGDTGADKIEKSDKLNQLWMAIAPFIKTKLLKAIFIEVSFPNKQPDTKLFGHLTPKWFYKEMESLGSYTGKSALNNFKVVITHRKPHANNEAIIKEELQKDNSLKLKLIFPQQAQRLSF
ncbi:MAG: 3',5'-cyclic-nucleotide phosphodiesterase [Flavobacteriaceae bacterium]